MNELKLGKIHFLYYHGTGCTPWVEPLYETVSNFNLGRGLALVLTERGKRGILSIFDANQMIIKLERESEECKMLRCIWNWD